MQTKAYKEPKQNKDGSRIVNRKSSGITIQDQGPPKPRPQIKAVLMTEFGRKLTGKSSL